MLQYICVKRRNCLLPCSSGGRAIVSYPNPADNEMNVQYAADESSADQGLTENKSDQSTASSSGTNAKAVKDFSVTLYNDKGKVLRSGKSGNGKGVVLNTSEIRNGNYFLHVIDGKGVVKKQVVIQH